MCSYKSKKLIDDKIFPDWCPLEDAPNTALHADSEGRVILESASILGDEETFNNGVGW